MTILVTGATGTVGTHVVAQLAKRDAEVRALVRDPAKAKLPKGVVPARGDMLDVDSMRRALDGVTTLFLLTAVVPDEFTQALTPSTWRARQASSGSSISRSSTATSTSTCPTSRASTPWSA